MTDLQLVKPDPPPPEFVFESKTYVHAPSGRTIVERVIVSGDPPDDFARFFTTIQEKVGVQSLPNGIQQPLMANQPWFSNAASATEAFAELNGNWDEIVKAIHAHAKTEIARARVANAVHSSLNGHNRIRGLRG